MHPSNEKTKGTLNIRYPNALAGVKKVYIAEILTLLAAVLALAAVIGCIFYLGFLKNAVRMLQK